MRQLFGSLLAIAVVAAVVVSATPALAAGSGCVGSAHVFCVTSTADSGQGSLRQAILDANSTANDPTGPDLIGFDLSGTPPYTIHPLNELPAITDGVKIDGSSQPGSDGAPVVTLAGNGFTEDGIIVSAANTTIKGVALVNFNRALLIVLARRPDLQCVDLLGLGGDRCIWHERAQQPGHRGFSRCGCSHRGATAADRNVIAGNDSDIDTSPTSQSVVVQGNYIGLGPSGTTILSTGSISLESASVTLGGLASTPGVPPGNVIDEDTLAGTNQASTAKVQGNLLGTDPTGESVPTDGTGQQLDATLVVGTNALVGGTDVRARNVLGRGVIVSDATNAKVLNNFIGTDITGELALPVNAASGHHGDCGSSGVEVESSSRTVIGASGAGNVISGMGPGLYCPGISFANTGNTNTIIQANKIGVDAAGGALGNTGPGIAFGAAFNGPLTIGGTSAGIGNEIAHNGGQGGVVVTCTASEADRNCSKATISGNSIHDNAGLGIALCLGDGQGANDCQPDWNDALDVDQGSNGLQNSPVITSANSPAGTTSIGGTLASEPGNTYHVELFRNDQCDGSG